MENINKNILLIIGGGIAAYKSLELIRMLKKSGCSINVILTKSGEEFVTELTVSQLVGSEVYKDLFDTKSELSMGHINLSRWADIVICAPATANLISKLANGAADDLASTTMLASDKPVLIIPGMNPKMWLSAANQENVDKIKSFGHYILGPVDGETACGEFGLGRMEEPINILDYLIKYFQNRNKLLNMTALVTAGPTIEPIDPVRFISNYSSGKQGYAIASQLAKYGAKTTLISGPTKEKVPEGVQIIDVNTAEEMLIAVKNNLPTDIGIFSAAVADWKVSTFSQQKIKKINGDNKQLELVENSNILGEITREIGLKPKLLIGFAAETENIEKNAKKKLHNSQSDWILANDVSMEKDVFNSDYNTISLISKKGVENWEKMTKAEVANKLAQKIVKHFE